MPKPIPVLMDDSRFLTTAAMASRCSGLILPVVTRLLINSSMASQRLDACNSVMICSRVRMSPRSIGSERVRWCISPEADRHFKNQNAKKSGPPDVRLGAISRICLARSMRAKKRRFLAYILPGRAASVPTGTALPLFNRSARAPVESLWHLDGEEEIRDARIDRAAETEVTVGIKITGSRSGPGGQRQGDIRRCENVIS